MFLLEQIFFVFGILTNVCFMNSNWIFLSIPAAKQPPVFVKEIVDIRTTEAETIKFECQYTGTPTPGM